MKILNILKEQEDDNQMAGISFAGGSYGHTVATLNEIQEKIELAGSFFFSNITIPNPNGNYKFIPTMYAKRESEDQLSLSIKIYLVIDSFEIPTDFLIFVTEWVMKRLKQAIPNIEELLNDPKFKKESIGYSFKDIFISKKDVFFTLEDYMDTMYYNGYVVRVHALEDLFNPQKINEVYSLDPSMIPTFSENFSVATAQMEKKIRNIYRGFRKGTYKGHQYEYKENNPRISILIDKHNYNPTTKVIHPTFKVSLNAGYVWIDGKPTSTFEPESNQFQDKDFVIEFDYYIKERFKQFGIKML